MIARPDPKPSREVGIPEVNTIVTIDANTHLLYESDIAVNEQEIAKAAYIFDYTKNIATIREYNLDGPLGVSQGAKVKILGYRLLGKPVGNRLFALVSYVSNPATAPDRQETVPASR